jgi:pantoate--beta-alanine ligase
MTNTPSLKQIKGVAEMHRFAAEARKKGHKIALVPTMGALHAGHLALVRAARKRADLVVVSIFVNPTQFGPREDLSGYPRDLPGDLEKLRELGVAAVFTPEAAEMFPPGHRAWVDVEDLSQRLCGRARPTHFRGVATVVLKLLQIVQPHFVWFGRKDYQQLVIIRKVVKDLNLEVEVCDVPIVRDKDGLALSSRNVYLTPEQRPAALTLQQAIQVAERIIAKGERSPAKIVSNMREVIRAQQGAEIEYIAVCHPETLHELDAVEVRTLVALAVRVGRARLIDNALFDLLAMPKNDAAAKAAAKAPPKPAAPAPAAVAAGAAKAPARAAAPAAKTPAKAPAPKPAAKPAAKPVPKPAAKPAVKPTAKPGAKPGERKSASR